MDTDTPNDHPWRDCESISDHFGYEFAERAEWYGGEDDKRLFREFGVFVERTAPRKGYKGRNIEGYRNYLLAKCFVSDREFPLNLKDVPPKDHEYFWKRRYLRFGGNLPKERPVDVMYEAGHLKTDVPDKDDAFESIIQSAEIKYIIATFRNKLNDKEKEIFDAVVFEKMTDPDASMELLYKRVGDHLKLSSSAVKSQWGRLLMRNGANRNIPN